MKFDDGVDIRTTSSASEKNINNFGYYSRQNAYLNVTRTKEQHSPQHLKSTYLAFQKS